MARLPRLTLAGYPHHIIQRGNNRQMIFADAQDFEAMLALLADNAQKFAVAVHAYVLMDNHFHLLATPATAEALPLMMQAVGRSYVRYFNQRHGRTGTLWEGRYRSTLIETERYLLACMVYIDLNPVRAAMVAQPAAGPGPATPITWASAVTNWSRRMRCTGRWVTRRLRARRPMRRWCRRASAVQSRQRSPTRPCVAGRWAMRILWLSYKKNHRVASPKRDRGDLWWSEKWR